MSLNAVPSSQRVTIGFFGRRNAGKSSLMNAVAGQALAVVSPVKGTTTDPVKKAMELLPFGPVVLIDTPGIDDDQSDLGGLRVEKTEEILRSVHIAVLVVDVTEGLHGEDEALLTFFREKKIPHLTVYSKSDLLKDPSGFENCLLVSSETGEGMEKLKDALGKLMPKADPRPLLSDLLSPGDLVVLVTPIDSSAPKGRLILPQQMVLRDILDFHAVGITTQVEELDNLLQSLPKPPKMVVTDSQVFGAVGKIVPENIPLTSFSILMARYRGELPGQIRGAALRSQLKDGDNVLIAEACTHRRQCDDIGRVKIPGWIEAFSKAKPSFSFTSGGEFPKDPSACRLIVHCGGCMVNDAEMRSRGAIAREAGVPMVNYGVAIAHMHGLLRRSLELFPDMLKLLDE